MSAFTGSLKFDRKKLMQYLIFKHTGFNYPNSYPLIIRQLTWVAVSDYLNYDVFTILAGYCDDSEDILVNELGHLLNDVDDFVEVQRSWFSDGLEYASRSVNPFANFNQQPSRVSELQKLAKSIINTASIQCPLNSGFKFFKLSKEKVFKYQKICQVKGHYNVVDGKIAPCFTYKPLKIEYADTNANVNVNINVESKCHLNMTKEWIKYIAGILNEFDEFITTSNPRDLVIGLIDLYLGCNIFHDFLLIGNGFEMAKFITRTNFNRCLDRYHPVYFSMIDANILAHHVARPVATSSVGDNLTLTLTSNPIFTLKRKNRDVYDLSDLSISETSSSFIRKRRREASNTAPLITV